MAAILDSTDMLLTLYGKELIGGEGGGRAYHIYFMPHIKENKLEAQMLPSSG